MAPDSNYYDVLGVPSDASQDQIRKAFRERVRACHPDRVANLDEDLRKLAEEKMVELNEAYAVLRNPARRAAYDDRYANDATRSTSARPVASSPQTDERPTAGTTAQPPPSHRGPIADPAKARNRIGEQQFVARAASEEFEHTVKSCVAGQVSWTPVDFRGATVALHGTKGRTNLYFVLSAAPQLDDKQMRRFLKSLETFGSRFKSRLWGKDRLFGFAAAVEFIDQERLRSALTKFNERRSDDDAVRPATLIDLVNWHVVPGETRLQERLDNLLRGR